MRIHRAGQNFPKAASLVHTLKRIDGIVQGWGKHYRFCNDEAVIRQLDETIKKRLSAYIGAYTDCRDRAPETEKQILLGIEKLVVIPRDPLKWPRK